MDKLVPQSGAHPDVGHDESDLSIRGIVTFGIILAVSGLLTFVGVRIIMAPIPYISIPWLASKVFPDTKLSPDQLTPAQQRLLNEREVRAAANTGREGARRPEAPGQRADEELRLERTFPAPRLQYDDTYEMQTFRGSEDKWLESAGKDAAGNIHISIDQAKKLLVQQGLPAVSGPFVPPTLPSAAPLVPAPVAQRK
jgi:hypothetical protein